MNSFFKKKSDERHPERIQDGESEETYIRRIAKFPTLSFETLYVWIFQPQRKGAGDLLADWFKNAFPKANWKYFGITLFGLRETIWENSETDVSKIDSARVSTQSYG